MRPCSGRIWSTASALLRDVLEQADGERARRAHRRHVRRRRRVGVGLDQELLLRQVHHQHVVGVLDAGDVAHLDRAGPVAQLPTVAHALHGRLPARSREVIGPHRRRRRDDLLEERATRVLRDDRRAFTREGAHAAGVIEVVMAHDQVLDRLARHQLAGFRDDGQRPIVVQRSLGDDQVVLHLDHDAVVRAAGHVPHALRRLLRSARACRDCRPAARCPAP